MSLFSSFLTKEFSFLISGLESTMSNFGWGINEFKINLFFSSSTSLCQQGFSKNKRSFLRSNTTSFNHQKVVVNNTIVRETTHGGNLFISNISWSGSIVLFSSFSYSVDFLVDLSSVVITQLTSSCDCESNSGRMPSTNASYFSVTSMCFLLQMFNTESFNDTCEPFTFGNTDNINHLIINEKTINSNLLFEKTFSEFNLFFFF